MIKTTLGIDGMMCSMCEAHVNDAIRRSFDVKSAKSNRRKKQCVVISEDELDRERLFATIEAMGYVLSSVESEPCSGRRLGILPW